MNETAKNEAETLLLNSWIVRVRRPLTDTSNRLFLLLHGLSGNEESMSVFSRNLPRDAWILSPRAPIPLEAGGFKWITHPHGMQASFSEFREAAVSLFENVSGWKQTLGISVVNTDVIGFSQGAVMAASVLLLYPQKTGKVGFLSGFLPFDTPDFFPPGHLRGKSIFQAHGTQDATVSFERARHTHEMFDEWGARVIFCEAAVGHRISANCFRGFADYFRDSAN